MTIPASGTNALTISGTPTATGTVSFTLPLWIEYTVQVYDIGPTWFGWGDPGRSLLGAPHTFSVVSDSTTLELPGYPDYREIDVTAQVIGMIPGGMMIGTGGAMPINVWDPAIDPTAEYVTFLTGTPAYSLTFFTNRPPTLLQQLANGLQLVQDLAGQFADKAGLVIEAITTNPGKFLDNLLTGLGDAAKQVFKDLTETPLLQNKLYKWLVGGVSGLSSLSSLDFSNTDNVKNFLLQYAGLTWDHLQSVLKQQLGAGNYAAATKVATLIYGDNFAQGGDPPPLLEFLKTLPARLEAIGFSPTEAEAALGEFSWESLSQELFNKAKAQLFAGLAQVAPRLLAKFVPGVGVAQSLYQGLTFVLQNQGQIQEFFTGFLNSIDDLVAGTLNDDQSKLDAYKAKLVAAIQGPGLDALLNFAAAQLGLNGLRNDLQKAISFLPNKVDAAMRKMVAAVAAKVVNALPGSLGNAGGLYAGQMGTRLPFTYIDTSYTLWVAKDRTGATKVKVASGPDRVTVLTEASFDNAIVANARERLRALVNAAQAMVSAGSVRDMATRQAALDAAQEAVKTDILNNACRALNAGCFAAGTKLLTAGGWRNVEDIEPGDLVLSRDETDPSGQPAWKAVEECFQRTGRVLHLHAGGEVVRTTPEHPFFVEGKGWVPAGELRPGDRLATLSGAWAAVEEAYDTGEYERVYNLRVADYRTYFVGGDGWPLALWAHNTYTMTEAQLLTWIQANVQVPAPEAPPTGTPGQIVASLPTRTSGASPVQGILVVNGQAYNLASMYSQQPGFSAVVTNNTVRRQLIGSMGVTAANYTHLEVAVALVIRKLSISGTITSAVLYENQKPCEQGMDGCHPRMGQLLPQGLQLQVVWPDRRSGQTVYYQTPYTGGQTPPIQGPRANATQVS